MFVVTLRTLLTLVGEKSRETTVADPSNQITRVALEI